MREITVPLVAGNNLHTHQLISTFLGSFFAFSYKELQIEPTQLKKLSTLGGHLILSFNYPSSEEKFSSFI